jgi:UDP-N-acetylglucosamine--N-acetylmuramyl-(pentapeptide) pyrophosphoryl-undecaprenol N-acetylglucosamine transferase
VSEPARFALVAGGGTAGHVQPALAVARALAAAHGPASVEMVGSRRGLERDLLAESGLPVTLLPGRGIQRRLSLGALMDNAAAAAALTLAGLQALLLVARRRPRVVVAVGGYASVPVGLAAALLRVPVVVVNVDAAPGAANRLLARVARASAVAWPGTALARAVVTGAPLRPEVVAAAAAEPARPSPDPAARAALGVPPGRSTVAVVGGSLGARRLNEAALALARRWAERGDLALYHVVGRRDAAWAHAEWDETSAGATGLWYRQVEYEAHMEKVLRAADVVVGRAGGMTVAEVAAVGTPALFVPLPGAPRDHQTANARVLVDVGAAVLVRDEDCDGERLDAELTALLADPARLEAMAKAALALGRPAATEAVVGLVEQAAEGAGA